MWRQRWKPVMCCPPGPSRFSALWLMMSLPLPSQEGQEDGADAVGVRGGGHRGSDRPARSPAGPQPAPSSVLFQIHHLNLSLPRNLGCFFTFFFFNLYLTGDSRSQSESRVQDWDLKDHWESSNTTRSLFVPTNNLTDEDATSHCHHGYRAHSWAGWPLSSNALWAAESNKDQM